MFNRLKNYFGFSSRDFSQDDVIPNNFYNRFDWNRTFVGGSYALKQFSGEKWSVNDIDIFICHPPEEGILFDTKVNRLIAEENGTILKENNHDINENSVTGSELFHEAICKTYTCKFPSIPYEVQFVQLNNQFVDKKGIYFNGSGQAVFNYINDVPASVSYTIDPFGKKVFNIPEKARRSVFERICEKVAICPSRLEKYTKRGYTFIENNEF